MGTSYVEYRGKGFWSWDGYLEDALAVLAEAVGADSPEWLKAAGKHWEIQAAGEFGGWIHAQLDDFLTTQERVQIFQQVLEFAHNRSDLTSEVRSTLELIGSLIRGEVQTDASSPLDYMVSGEYRRMRE
ncbi:MAG: hypothetical protein J0L64_17260 [Acidobacteria bacterium]|nr:hypothetical protein [Acidobacteriota bacterium]